MCIVADIVLYVLDLQSIILSSRFSRKCVPGAGGDGKVSLQLAHKLGGHSLGAVDITAFHNVASDVRIESIRLFINRAVTRPSGRHDSRVLSRF